MRWWKDRKYKDGDWRIIKRFLWLPKCLPISSLPNDIKQYRWLEISKLSQRYHVSEGIGPNYWEDRSWYQS